MPARRRTALAGGHGGGFSATFGALVYVVQEGHLRWLVGDFTPTGTLETTLLVLVFCIAFGLSMDYEVFLLCPA